MALTANDYRRVEQWYRQIAAAAGDDLEVLPWTELDTFLSTMLRVQDGSALVFMVIIFLSLSFGLVNTLVNETREAGWHYVTWDGSNLNGEEVATGMYFYKIVCNDFSDTKKMLILK